MGYIKKLLSYCLFLFTMLFSCIKIDALLRPTKEMFEMRSMLQQYNKKYQEKREKEKIKRQLNAEIKKLNPEEFFVYEEDTSNGVVVSEDIINECKNLHSMINVGRKMSDQISDQNVRAIPVPYPFDTIKMTFELLRKFDRMLADDSPIADAPEGVVKKFLFSISLEEWVTIIDFATSYLGIEEQTHKGLLMEANRLDLLAGPFFTLFYKAGETFQDYDKGPLISQESEKIEHWKEFKGKIDEIKQELEEVWNKEKYEVLKKLPLGFNNNFYKSYTILRIVGPLESMGQGTKIYFGGWGIEEIKIDEARGAIFINDKKIDVFGFFELLRKKTEDRLNSYTEYANQQIAILKKQLERWPQKLYRWLFRENP
jgi:hypothetical protein